jgi:hypothetical protein
MFRGEISSANIFNPLHTSCQSQLSPQSLGHISFRSVTLPAVESLWNLLRHRQAGICQMSNDRQRSDLRTYPA